MKYRLLKDLPLAKAGDEIYLVVPPEEGYRYTMKDKNAVTVSMIDEKYIPEWLEEVKEPKTIYDLWYDECYWYLDTQNTVHNTRTNYPDKQWWKWNEHNCCFLTEREAKRNKLLRELATRTSKHLPEKWEIYYSIGNDWCTYWQWNSDNRDYIAYHMWLVFCNEEEYNKYMTAEEKDLLFKI